MFIIRIISFTVTLQYVYKNVNSTITNISIFCNCIIECMIFMIRDAVKAEVNAVHWDAGIQPGLQR